MLQDESIQFLNKMKGELDEDVASTISPFTISCWRCTEYGEAVGHNTRRWLSEISVGNK